MSIVQVVEDGNPKIIVLNKGDKGDTGDVTPEAMEAAAGAVQAKEDAQAASGVARAAATTALNSAQQAMASAHGYTSTALALADAGLPVNATFSVPLTDGSLQAYIKTSSTVATVFGASFATASSVKVLQNAVLSPLSLNNKRVAGSATGSPVTSAPMVDVVNWRDGSLGYGLDADGVLRIGKYDENIGAAVAVAPFVGGDKNGALAGTALGSPVVKLPFADVWAAPNGSLGFGITSDGVLRIGKYDENMAAIFGLVILSTVAAFGDSLTAGYNVTTVANYWTTLLQILIGRQVTNLGIAGQDSTSIMWRQGGLAPMLTLSSGIRLAASGTQAISWTGNDSYTQNMHGTLRGVSGTLARTSTFTPDAGNTATPIVPAGTPFQIDANIHMREIHIFWVGTNDLFHHQGDVANFSAKVMANLARGIAFMKGTPKKFIIMTPLCDASANKSSAAGSTAALYYAATVSLGQQIMAAYPNNAIDIRSILVASYNPALPQDVIDFGNDVVPTSLRTNPSTGVVDSLHPSDPGQPIIAQEVYNLMLANGY